MNEARLHPFYEQLEEKYPGMIRNRLKDFSELTLTSDLYVIRGITRFLETPSRIENSRNLNLPHDSPETIITILHNISTNAVLNVEEAKKLKSLFKKVKEKCNKHTATFNNHGLIEKIFSFYTKKQLPHHLALRICTTLTPQSQEELLKQAGNRLNKLLVILSRSRFRSKFRENQENNTVENPTSDFLESMIDEILGSTKGRKLLAKKLYKKTNNPTISLIIKNLEE